MSLVETINEIKNVADALNAAIPSVLLAAGAIVGACATISAKFKKPENSGILFVIHSIVNKIGMNVGEAKNQK